jgi:hypothetical protein
MYSCHYNYPVVAVSSANPLQKPPSATANVIVSCHELRTLCYKDLPTLPFQLFPSDSMYSLGVSYVSVVDVFRCGTKHEPTYMLLSMQAIIACHVAVSEQ